MSELEKKSTMCNEDEVVKIVKLTMLPDIRELSDSISNLRGSINTLIEIGKKDTNEFTKDLGDLKADVAALKKVVYGNGDAGLTTKMSNVDKWMEARVWFERLIIGAVVVQIIGLLFLFIQNSLSH